MSEFKSIIIDKAINGYQITLVTKEKGESDVAKIDKFIANSLAELLNRVAFEMERKKLKYKLSNAPNNGVEGAGTSSEPSTDSEITT